MVKKSKTAREKELIRRYLVWCYKTTKEDLDRIERYFTQFEADTFLLKTLRAQVDYQKSTSADPYRKLVDDFEPYLKEKHHNALKKKFVDPSTRPMGLAQDSARKSKEIPPGLDETHAQLQPQYRYLRNRFTAIERTIVHFFGRKELKVICRLYEEEMTARILDAREHT